MKRAIYIGATVETETRFLNFGMTGDYNPVTQVFHDDCGQIHPVVAADVYMTQL